MSNAISLNDLVRVVGSGCACEVGKRQIGRHFIVKRIVKAKLTCLNCKEIVFTGFCTDDPTTEGCGFALTWLKKIPPYDELKGKPTQEPLREPELEEA